MPDPKLALLNTYEVHQDGVTHHLVCFLDPVLAGSRGIDPRSILGSFTPGEGGTFDLQAFRLNPEFVAAFTQYMNEAATLSPQLLCEAANYPSGWLYIIDPRFPDDSPEADPPASEVVGCFAVDDAGQIVPKSFQYNKNHAWFDPETGVSDLLSDRQFYDWLHPSPGR
jgi:hypothetical protein